MLYVKLIVTSNLNRILAFGLLCTYYFSLSVLFQDLYENLLM